MLYSCGGGYSRLHGVACWGAAAVGHKAGRRIELPEIKRLDSTFLFRSDEETRGSDQRMLKPGKIAALVALLLVIWLAFELFVSWAAFCNYPEEYGSSYQTTEEYGCIFKGPVVSLVGAFVTWWRY